MAKKYLLYIHQDKFDKEKQKSALVNLLLDRHYDYYEPGTLVEDMTPDGKATERFDTSVVGNAEVAEILRPERKVAEIRDKLYLERAKDVEFAPCKHGADPKMCRFAKNGQPCKVK